MSGQLNIIDRPSPESNAGDTNNHRAINRKRRGEPFVLLNINDSAISPPSVPSTPYQVLSDQFYSDEEEILRKRRRYDSSFSTLSDESDSQIPFSYEPLPWARWGRRQPDPFSNGDIIGDFKVIGSGYEAKAILSTTNAVFNCKVLSEPQADCMSKLIARLDESQMYYPKSDLDEMRNMIIPEEACLVQDNRNRFIFFSPANSHVKTLHCFAESKGQDMTELDVKPIFQQIIRMVAFCHRIGIIVRELKPKKIGLTKNGGIRLNYPWDLLTLDSPQSDIIKEKLKGSPAYAPPEALCSSEEGYSGRAADMWGLGVLLYLLLLGRYPFYDRTPLAVFQKIMQARVIVPSHAVITKHGRMLLFCLLRKRASDRPSAEDLLYLDWIGAHRLPARSAYLPRSVTIYDPLSVEFRHAPASRNLDIALNSNTRDRSDESNFRLGMLQSIHNNRSNQGTNT